MGKRELLIAAVFVLAGVVVYHFAAPPAAPGTSFSWAHVWQTIRRGPGARERAEVQSHRAIPLATTVRQLRLRGFNGGVRVIGETRADLDATLVVTATAVDQPSADAAAKAATLEVDTLEDAVVLSVSAASDRPARGRPLGAVVRRLDVRVPAGLAVSVDGGSSIDIEGVAAVRLQNAMGSATIKDISGAVTGDGRAGMVEVDGAGAVDLSLSNARTTIRDVRGTTHVDVRSGRCTLQALSGAIDVEMRSATVSLVENTATASVHGTDGRLLLRDPRADVHTDLQGTAIDAQLAHAIAASLSTADADITLGLVAPGSSPPPPILLDAVATNGDVRTSDWPLTPETQDHQSRLEHAFGNGAHVSVRTTNGNVILTKISSVEIDKGE